MKQGGDYIFSFYVGFGKTNPRNNSSTAKLSLSPLRLSIFGHASCSSAFPYNTPAQAGCPALSADWVELGTATLYGNEEWVQGSIEFTAPFDINAITIGPACGPVPYLGSDQQFFYYIDQVALAPKTDFDFKRISRLSGDACGGNYRLQAPLHPSATYQ